MNTRKLILALTLVAGAGLALAGPLSPPAGPIAATNKTLSEVEPRTPIDHLPISLSQSGSYYLTRSLTATGPGHGITVVGSRITLDLNGFSLDGIPGSGDAIHAPGTTNLVVKNGSIRTWGGSAIDTTGAGSSVIDRLAITGCLGVAIVAGPLSEISDCQVIGDPAGGIVTAFGCRVTGCSVTDCGSSGSSIGISMTSSGSVYGALGRITDCTSSRNQGYGIRLDAESVATGCNTHLNSAAGIWAAGQDAVERCVSSNNTLDGITAGDRVTIRFNTCNDNGDDGIQAGDHTTIVHNSCHDNGPSASGAGVYLLGSGNTRISDNDLTDNRYGVLANNSNSNLIMRNTAFANGGGNFLVMSGNDIAPIPLGLGASWAGVGPFDNLTR